MKTNIPPILVAAALSAFTSVSEAQSIDLTLSYIPGELQGFGAPAGAGPDGPYDVGPHTFSDIDGSGVSLTLSASSPVLWDAPLASVMGIGHGLALGSSAILWEISPGYSITSVSFDYIGQNYNTDEKETFSNFTGFGGGIASAVLTNATGNATWDGSALLAAPINASSTSSGTFTLTFNSPVSGFGWDYDRISGDPDGIGIAAMRLTVQPVPEPSGVLLFCLTGTLAFLRRRRSA